MTSATDERRARQMVQYHIEGEHVFPEPECPSCRAGRLDEALERVQKLQDDAPWWAKNDPWLKSVEGWAGAAKLLDCWHQEAYEDSDGSELMPPVMHDGICDAACGDPCKPCRARGSFCDAMLGGRDEQH